VTGYSTREVAEVLGLPTSTILSWTRAGLLTPVRGPRGAYLFSFRDIVLLRTARELLDADVSALRVRRTLEALRGHLPGGRPLSAVHMEAIGDRVLIRDEDRVWDPRSGQLLMPLDTPHPAHDDPMVVGRIGWASTVRASGPGARAPATADEWYDAAVDLEGEAPDRARRAYARALALDPGHADAHLNLGRLLHEDGAVVEAEAHYRTALVSDPASARAFYNLGVALEDQERRPGAVEAYEAALRLDPELAVAHFNLSRLLEAMERPSDALAHLAAYKRILDRGGIGA
jgi:DNA-binding transcriptional MerR regulator